MGVSESYKRKDNTEQKESSLSLNTHFEGNYINSVARRVREAGLTRWVEPQESASAQGGA